MANVEKSDKKKQNIYRWVRWLILLSIFIISTTLTQLHQFYKVAKVQGVDAFCPFGAIESLFSFVGYGFILKRLALTNFIIIIAVLIVAFLFRRAFCGQICTLGAIQEFFANIGKKIFKKNFIIPVKVDKPLRYLKYLIFAIIVIWQSIVTYKLIQAGTPTEIQLVIRPYDPWATFNHLLTAEVFTDFLIGFLILIFIVVVGSFLFDRFFCKYICPMGAFLGLINKIGLFKITRNTKTCIMCKACNKACPVNIDVMSVEKVNSSECINCNECVNACPVKDTLYIEGPKKKKISPLALTLVTTLIFIIVLGVTTVTGQFQWMQPTLKTEVQTTGSFDPALIKGSSTFKEISEASGVPKEAIMEKFKITEEDFNLAIKDVKAKYGFETEDVRTFIKEYLEKNKK
jgi:polyferredoxin